MSVDIHRRLRLISHMRELLGKFERNLGLRNRTLPPFEIITTFIQKDLMKTQEHYSCTKSGHIEAITSNGRLPARRRGALYSKTDTLDDQPNDGRLQFVYSHASFWSEGCRFWTMIQMS
jgi:hypothetical protein